MFVGISWRRIGAREHGLVGSVCFGWQWKRPMGSGGSVIGAGSGDYGGGVPSASIGTSWRTSASIQCVGVVQPWRMALRRTVRVAVIW